jgi:hypothetical protein
MRHRDLSLIEGIAALDPLEQLTEEFAKDKWDARLIPGLRYAPHTTMYYIDFQRIPAIFRPVIKVVLTQKSVEGKLERADLTQEGKDHAKATANLYKRI